MARYKRVFLLYLHTSSYYSSLRPPTGIGYLSEILKTRGIEHETMDLRFVQGENRTAAVKEIIERFKPDLIGFTVFTFAYKESYSFINEVKRLAPNAHIIVGGPHISTIREEFLRQCPEVDYGCVKEGDDLLPELCGGKPLGEIPNLLYRENGEIKYAGDRPYILNLDVVPWPKYEKFDLSHYIAEKGLISSRGCPFQCTFCSIHATTGRRFRMRSAKNMVDEIEYWYSRGFRQFNFLDDNFTLLEKRVYEFCAELERRNITKGLILRATNGVRADMLDRPMLTRMKEVGFKSLMIGVESASPKVLKILKKGETIEEIREAVTTACDLGYDITLSFIYGTPGETVEDIEQSVAFAKEMPVTSVNFNSLMPYPKTEIYQWIERNNRFHILPEVYMNTFDKHEQEPIFDTDELPCETRIKLYTMLRGVEREVRSRRIKRIFKRYYPINVLVAYVFNLPAFQYLVRNNIVMRKVLEKIRAKVVYSD